jgi:alpha-tubulin suppressor-like RCC1 family protein
VQIGALTTWYQVAGGGYHFSVATTNGYALWAWGSNGYGQLGQNDIANRSSPVQVGALTTWYQVAAGRGTVFAIKLDGTLWGWGRNGNGELGLNNAANRSSPVQIGALTNWYQVAAGSRHTLAIKADGTLWSWGYNSFGQLGLNDTTERSSPVQVGALTNWYQVVGGYNHTLAIKNDGSLWAWGLNGTGELGIDLGAGTDRSSPVQVGALTTWLQVAGGRNFSLAIKTDNTLWSWGQNSYGKLGQNNTANRSSPVQVGALTTWLRIPKMPMAQHSLAIRG